MNNNDNKEMRQMLAILESKLDIFESELSIVNEMLIRCGFPEGVKTLKETMVELLQESEKPLTDIHQDQERKKRA